MAFPSSSRSIVTPSVVCEELVRLVERVVRRHLFANVVLPLQDNPWIMIGFFILTFRIIDGEAGTGAGPS
jgi:hypothetical protein